MRIVMAGAGAVGCHYASQLVQAGVDVACLARGEHLRAMRAHGLTHISNGVERKVDIEAGDDPAILVDADIVILTCKMTGFSAMLKAIAGHIRSDALIVTLQNGVLAPTIVAEALPLHSVAAGSAFIGVRIERPGVAVHSAAGGIRAGMFASREMAAKGKLRALLKALNRAGVDAREESSVPRMLWRKMLWNCGFNAITALTHNYARDVAECDGTKALSVEAMRETVAVAQAEGIQISAADIERHLQATLRMGPVKTSMWQDIEYARPTEVDYMNGFVAKRASELGLKAPVNGMLASMIRAREREVR